MLKIRQLFMLFFAVSVSLFAASWTENERQALNEAVGDARKSIDLNGSVMRDQNILILPLQGDQESIVFAKLKTLLVTDKKFTVVEDKDSAALDAIAKEFAWNERTKDIMLPESLVSFGKLLGAQVIVYGRIREVSSNADRVYAELELFATQIETRKTLWGGVFAGRYVPGGNLRGGFAADPHIVSGIKQAFKQFDESLKKSKFLATEISTRSVVTLDLAGDFDKYVGKRTYELLTENGVTPRELGYSTLTQARAYMRDNKLKADAYLYGAIRAMHSLEDPENPKKEVDLKTRMTTVHHPVFVEIELRIVAASNEDILWAQSVAESFDDPETRPATVREIAIETQVQKQIDDLVNKELKDKSAKEIQQKTLELRIQLIAEEKEKERMAEEAAQKAEAARDASQTHIVKCILWGVGGIALLALVLFILRGMMSNVKIR